MPSTPRRPPATRRRARARRPRGRGGSPGGWCASLEPAGEEGEGGDAPHARTRRWRGCADAGLQRDRVTSLSANGSLSVFGLSGKCSAKRPPECTVAPASLSPCAPARGCAGMRASTGSRATPPAGGGTYGAPHAVRRTAGPRVGVATAAYHGATGGGDSGGGRHGVADKGSLASSAHYFARSVSRLGQWLSCVARAPAACVCILSPLRTAAVDRVSARESNKKGM